MDQKRIEQAAALIAQSRSAIAFTGAGISAESGIPTFRGSADSVWKRYDPSSLEYDYYIEHPAEAWPCIREVFYKYTTDPNIVPNKAHRVLARLESVGKLRCVVTQNVDDLHQRAGSRTVHAFHGSVDRFECLGCHAVHRIESVDLDQCPPRCPSCGAVLKPGFVFFGEGIPEEAYSQSMAAAREADLVIVVGTTGEVMPAAMVPREAWRRGAKIIEVNTQTSAFTDNLTDVHLQGGAVEVFAALEAELVRLGVMG